jgi:hypothetical protein
VQQRVKKLREHKIFGKPIFIKDHLHSGLDIQDVINVLSAKIPKFLFHKIDVLYVGEFDFLVNKEVNALYLDSAIYVTNLQDNIRDMVDDIVHELAHSIEENYGHEIYSDGNLELEFSGKRKTLERILRANKYDTSKHDFLSLQWNTHLDNFFYKIVGYPMMNNLVNGLFASAYGATSLREYFANGFEEYYLGDRKYLFEISPKLFQKIDMIDQIGEQYS